MIQKKVFDIAHLTFDNIFSILFLLEIFFLINFYFQRLSNFNFMRHFYNN